MPIVFVHGVNVRDDSPDYSPSLTQLEAYLRHFIAPVIAADPEHVKIIPAYWGDTGAQFAWGGASRPRSPLLGMGSDAFEISSFDKIAAVEDLRNAFDKLPIRNNTRLLAEELIPAGPRDSSSVSNPLQRLRDLTPDQLSDLTSMVIESLPLDAYGQTQLVLAADVIVRDPNTFLQLATCSDSKEEVAQLRKILARVSPEDNNLVGMGTPFWSSDFEMRMCETLGRAVSLPGFLSTRIIAEARNPIHNLIANFLRDVFFYLAHRGTAEKPGAIPSRVLEKLVEARDIQQQRLNEPLIVLTHSMGGQVIYDLVTHFLPNMDVYSGIRIDFWCAAASQVGFFEELKLFLASSPIYSESHENQVPFPNRQYLGGWWNVWDHNDFISFTAHRIVNEVDDSSYNCGMSILQAHGGYLKRPSFYHTLATKIEEAKTSNWGRP